MKWLHKLMNFYLVRQEKKKTVCLILVFFSIEMRQECDKAISIDIGTLRHQSTVQWKQWKLIWFFFFVVWEMRESLILIWFLLQLECKIPNPHEYGNSYRPGFVIILQLMWLTENRDPRFGVQSYSWFNAWIHSCTKYNKWGCLVDIFFHPGLKNDGVLNPQPYILVSNQMPIIPLSYDPCWQEKNWGQVFVGKNKGFNHYP